MLLRTLLVTFLIGTIGLPQTTHAAEQTVVEVGRTLDESSFDLQDAKLERSDQTLRMTTGLEASWPGVTFKPPGEAWDLSSCDHLSVDVKNLKPHEVTLFCRVDNPGSDGTNNCVTERIRLGPNQRGTLLVPLREKMPEPLQSKLFGMRGYPGGWDKQRGIDSRRISGILLFVHRPESEQVFEIFGVTGSGERLAGVPTTADELFPMIDRFGQFMHKDWPGKTKSEADLAQRMIEEKDDLSAHPAPPDWNQYGGWEAGPQLEATGRFRPAKHGSRWWLVDPAGRLFWSHGVDCVRSTTGTTPITDRKYWFADLPGNDSPFSQFYGRGSWAPHGYYQDKPQYETFNFTGANLLRKYGPDWRDEFAPLCHRRLRSWGMNTIANWSDVSICRLRKTAYTANVSFRSKNLEGSQGYWGKFPDVFDPSFAEGLRRGMAQHQGGAIGDAWCMGYFVSNELSWGDDVSLALATLASPPDQAAKQVFVSDLRSKYETIDRLNQRWGTQYESWDALRQSTTPPSAEQAGDDLGAFYTKIAEQYFRMCRDVVKQFDPDGLYLGCRFAWANDRAVRAAAKFCDVVSFNRYARSVEGLQLPDGIDRPLVIGEFHFGALDRGMFHTGLVKTANQQERAEAYENYVRGALGNPWIVGTHWFQFGDQATTGRGDGENYQIGLLDICDTPYPETVAACREVGNSLYPYRERMGREP